MHYENIHSSSQLLQDPTPITYPPNFFPKSIESNLYIPNSLGCGAIPWIMRSPPVVTASIIITYASSSYYPLLIAPQ